MAVKDGLPATDFSRQNREWVKAVAGGGSGGGGGLPEITPADEGKVLTVESGAAAWATAGGGGGLVVTDSYDQATEQTILSVTAQQIIDAMQTGPVIYMQTNILDSDPPTEYTWKYLSVYYISDDPHDYDHTFVFGDDSTFYANSLSDYPKNPGDPLPGE